MKGSCSTSFLLCALALLTITTDLWITSSTASPIIVPFAPKQTSKKFFWYATDDGGFVPAFLEGGSSSIKADEDDIKFYLFTLQNQDKSDELLVGDESSFTASHYVPGAPLKILSHGFSSHSGRGPGPSFKQAYFASNNNYNVILIDWSKHAAAPWYDVAAKATRLVGQKTGDLIKWLVGKGVVTLDDIHFGGHSLGAHIGGFVGNNVASLGKLNRITAFDPALPLFESVDESERIDPTDAEFVDVIHTAGGTILEGGLSFKEPRGHADFYPNGGEPHQPGCGIDLASACSHSRSYHLFQESINNPNAFLSCRCNTWDEYNIGSCPCTETQHMGEHVNRSARGKYYLKTNSDEPWSQS